ncbi:unnamed protein product, partial [Notodromas monacha]
PASTATFDISDTEDDDDDVDVDECTSPKCSSVGRTELKTGSFERPHVVQPAHSNKAYDDADEHSDHSSNGEPGKAEYFRSSFIAERQQCKDYKPAAAWKRVSGMTQWCRNNCEAGFCPESHCICLK